MRALPDLGDWLKQIGLEQLAGILAANDVDFDVLAELTDADLEKLGISLGHRKRLLKAISSLRGTADARSDASQESAPPAAAPPSEAGRRQVTVLFSDLVGSTELASVVDPEDMSRLVRRYQDACAGALARFEGFIAQFMGDGVLAYFGYPQAREDAAERAVRAALAIIDAVSVINRPDGRPIEARIGIATGLVVVGDIIGTGPARQDAIIGGTPNLAARLQSLAKPSTILVSQSTHRLLGRLFEFESLGEHTLKGFSDPVRAWRVLRESNVASRFAAVRAANIGPFVGREQEMGLLLDRWHLAQHREGQVVLLAGEPGMGKSRLVETLHERIGNEPHRRIHLQCSPYHANTAFYPIMRQLEQAAGIAFEDPAADKLDKLDVLLARMPAVVAAPLFADLLSLPTDGRYPPLEFAPVQRKAATISALIDFLIHLSEFEPVLLTVEDAQWIDPTTQELLTRFIDAITAARVLMIVTGRPDVPWPWSGRDHITSLALNRLSKTHCAEIIAGLAAAQVVTPQMLEDILAKAEGVPLFVEELTTASADSPGLGVPATLQDSLMARLDRLGKAKEVAQIAAVIGRQFSYALLAAVSPFGTQQLDAELAQLMEAGLVFSQSRAIEPSYSFKHALTCDVAYDSLLRSRRLQLHEQIAHVLQERFPALAQAEPEILAHHFSQAGLAGPASIYRERAGEHAVARSAYAEALAHFEAALLEVSRLATGEDRDRRELAVLLKHAPAVIVFKGHRSPEVEQAYRRAYEIAKGLGDDQTLFKAIWGLWFCANMGGRTDVALNRAEELVDLAQRSGDECLFLEAIHCRWSTAFFRGDVSRSLADSREGVRRYDPEVHSRLTSEFGGHDPGVCAYTVLALALAQAGRTGEAKNNIETSLTLAQKLNQPSSLAHALMNALHMYQVIGERKEISRLGRQMIEIADKFNLPVHRSIANFFSGWANAAGGEFDDALRAMESEFARLSATAPLPQYYATLLAGIRLENGNAVQALELLDRTLNTLREPGIGFYVPEMHRLRGECLLRLGSERFDEAIGEFETSIGIAAPQQAHAFELRAAIALARAWAAAGQPSRGTQPLQKAVAAFSGDDGGAELASARQILAAHR